jgi:ribosomal-protein-alanine N-acetyltransferase
MPGKNLTQFPILKTERLTLRQLKNSDDKEIFDLRSNDNVNKYLQRKPSQSIDDAKNFIQTVNQNIQRNNSVYWAITLTGIDRIIGTICLFNFSGDLLKAEIGYELLPNFQGKGIMQEATSKVIYFGFQDIGVNSIEAHTHPENQSSIRLLEKLNFKWHSTLDDDFMLFQLMPNS